MPFSAPAKPTVNAESEPAGSKAQDMVSNTNETSEPHTASSLTFSPCSLNYEPFATPPFSEPHQLKGHPGVASSEGVFIPTEPLKVLSDRQNLSRFRVPTWQWSMYQSYEAPVPDHTAIMPPSLTRSETTRRAKQEDILDYVYDWAAWAAEIPDPCRRSEVLEFVTRALERALKSGMERTQMVLGPGDVEGTKTGTKNVLDGEVDIQVIIRSIVSEKTVGKLLAVPEAEDNLAKNKQAEIDGTAITPPLETVPEVIRSTQDASDPSVTKRKRAVNDTHPTGKVQKSKRRKAHDTHTDLKAKSDATGPIDAQSQGQLGRQDTFSSESTSSLSPAEDDNRAHYRKQVFRSRLNHILKKAGKAQIRGECDTWETVRKRLKDAGVSAKWRNVMLKDFCMGHRAWNGDSAIDPNEGLARFAEQGFEEALRKASTWNANKVNAEVVQQAAEAASPNIGRMPPELESMPALSTENLSRSAVLPAEPLDQPPQLLESSQLVGLTHTLGVVLDSTTAPKKLVITLPTFSGFDPEDYSLYNEYQHENFMFTFKPTSTVTERVLIGDLLRGQIEKKLNTAVVLDKEDDVDHSKALDCKRQFIKNKRGKIVATGNFVDLNSHFMLSNRLADPKQPWMWKGAKLVVDLDYRPSAWTGRLRQVGERLAASVEK